MIFRTESRQSRRCVGVAVYTLVFFFVIYPVIGTSFVGARSVGGVLGQRIWESGQGDRFAGAVIENLRMINDNDGTEALRLADNEARMDGSVDLLLLGNSREEMFSPFYTIRAEDVIIDNVLPLFGTGSMRFVSPENRIVLTPRQGALLSDAVDMGSFSFDFWIYPNARGDEDEIFSRYGSVIDESGSFIDTGIRIFFRSNRVVLSFHNIFRDTEGRYRNVEIRGETMVNLRQWQHIAFSYDARSGKLSRLVNGIEDSIVWATDTGRFGGSPFRAAFPQGFRRNAQIGGGFRGRLDSFRIRRSAWDNPSLSRYSDTPGRVTSRVFDMGTPRARLASITWDAESPAGSAVFVEYRISDSIFHANNPSMLWTRVRHPDGGVSRNGTDAMSFARGGNPESLSAANGANGARGNGQNGNSQWNGFEVPSGRYVQWRAILMGSESGRVTPILRNVRITWEPAHQPDTPAELRARAGDRRVLLSWRGNLDRIAGYRIYVGTQRGEYLHPASPIDIPLNLINQRTPEFVVRNLENDRLYYFSVVAYTAEGMLSEFSNEVFARPCELGW